MPELTSLIYHDHMKELNTLVLDLSQFWSPVAVSFSVISKPNTAPVLNYPSLLYHSADDTLLQGFTGQASSSVEMSRAPDSLTLWRLKLGRSKRQSQWYVD